MKKSKFFNKNKVNENFGSEPFDFLKKKKNKNGDFFPKITLLLGYL